MLNISIDDLVVPEDRIRKEFKEKDLLLLAESIWRVGLLQPIVLREDQKTLIAGDRRRKAITLLCEDDGLRLKLETQFGQAKPETTDMIKTRLIPCHIGSEWLSTTELLEAELFENIHRVDVTWQERTAALAKLHQLRVEQKGKGGSGSRADIGESGQTIKDTAKEAFQTDDPTSYQQQSVSMALDLAGYLDDPFVAAAPDERTAAKIVRDMRAAKARKDAADALEGKTLAHSVVHGDIYEILSVDEVPFPRQDIILLDPPYGRDMHKHAFETRHEYDDSRDVFDRVCKELLYLLFDKVAAPKAHMYVFCDVRDFDKVALAAVGSGWDVWGWPLIWDKGNVGTFGNAKQGPRHCYDAIVYCYKGGMQPTAMYRDVIPLNQQQGLAHPAGKPVALYMDLLRRSATAGMKVFDPMVGGGTFFDACSEVRVYGTGVEISEKYYHMALERVSELTDA